MNQRRLENKVAVIVGGSSGIGLASARLFHQHGASIVIVGQNPVNLEKARAELGGNTLAVQANAGKLADIQRLYAQVKQVFGRIDVLFLNAGMSACPPIEQTDEAFFDHIMAVNLKSAFFGFAQALPLLSEHASVIITGSASQDMGHLGKPLYSASKAAIRSLVRTFAVEDATLAKHIRVNALIPGCTITPLTEPAVANADVRAYVEAAIPMKRWATVEEIAPAALFLACDDASYMTGAELAVDGGIAQV